MKKIFVLLVFFLNYSAFAQLDESFFQRLSPDLSLSGLRCKGGELSEVSERVCEKGQWLVMLDNINSCVEDRCTELHVPAFIAKLKRIDIIPNLISYNEIIPEDFMSSSRRRILGRYWVRFDLNGRAAVLRRFGKEQILFR